MKLIHVLYVSCGSKDKSVQPGKKNNITTFILSGLFFKHVSLLLKEVHLEWQNLAAWRDFSFFSEIIDKLLKPRPLYTKIKVNKVIYITQ